jgi:uncharacterized protein (TIGR02466 family)
MKGNIAHAFPTPIMLYDVETPFTENELACIEEYKKETMYNLANHTTSDLFVFEHPKFASLKQLCQRALDDYFSYVFDPINPDKVRLKITQSWVNYTNKGDHHHQHHHHNSVVSGCLYIKANKDIDKIKFIKDNGTNWFVQPKNLNAYNSPNIFVPVGTGNIVLFPSHLDHSVPKTTGEQRISIAFNSFFDGELGFMEGDMKGVNFLKVETK